MRRLLLPLLLVALATPTSAVASGMTTHAWMADRARAYVETPELRRLLDSHRTALMHGGAYPDGGYAVGSLPGGDYGEVSHWGRFAEGMVDALLDRADCGDLADPGGACSEEVAFLMGIAAHGIGDEMWDWLFEPNARDRGESSVHPVYRSGVPGASQAQNNPIGGLQNSIEYAMDMIAIVEGLRAQEVAVSAPPIDTLLAAYRKVGRADITREGVVAGTAAIAAALSGERFAAVSTEYARVKLTMPWTSEHMDDESGGVDDVGQAAAGIYETLWAKLTSDERAPAPTVVAVHPEPGERGVPTDFHSANAGPGPNGGGAQQRILASISSHLPSDPDLRTDAVLVDGETGEVVEQQAGWPRPGPYGNGDGTHTFMLRPAAELAPCRWYRVVLRGDLADHRGARLGQGVQWTFQTRAAPGQADLPDGCLTDAQATAPFTPQASPGPNATDALARLGVGGFGHAGHHHGRGAG